MNADCWRCDNQRVGSNLKAVLEKPEFLAEGVLLKPARVVSALGTRQDMQI